MTEWRNTSSCSLSSHAIKFAASCGGSLPLFDADFFFLVHNLYIYLTCFCVRWPPAFFKGRVLRDFLSCSLALFWSRKLLLPFHKQEEPANAEALLMPPSWDGSLHVSRHTLSQQQSRHAPSRRRGRKARSSSCSSGADLCHCVSVFHTNTGPAESAVCLREWRGVESSSHTHVSRRNLPPLLPVENTWRGQDGEIKKQNETKRGRRG